METCYKWCGSNKIREFVWRHWVGDFFKKGKFWRLMENSRWNAFWAFIVYISLCLYHMFLCFSIGASLMAQQVKNLPAIQELQEAPVWALGQDDPLEEAMATHSSILAWKIPWTKEPDGLQSKGLQRGRPNWAPAPTYLFFYHTA